ncbi:hypothetical protein BGZ76_007840 [Entomortierella beljakovae]|nr:hypothetical protein BGZ76_007840 [Entomortierella beljakovae]
MKFTIVAAAAFAMLASIVSAQDPSACTACLQSALKTLPACANAQPPADGEVSAEYAACLCSSLSGSWMDSCSGAAQCGSGVSNFKAAYSANIQEAGLDCSGEASFNAPA